MKGYGTSLAGEKNSAKQIVKLEKWILPKITLKS